MLKDSYDVIVVGAGPSGLRLSRLLAEHRLKVLCVDKKQEIGAPKRCGEGLGGRAFVEFGMKPDPRWALQEINGAYCFAPNLNYVLITTDTPGYILERKMWEKDLAQWASEAGAQVLAKTQALNLIIDGEIKGVKVERAGEVKEVKCDMVVGADGIDSKIGREVGLKTHSTLKDVDSGFQYEMCNLSLKDPAKIEIYFGNEIAPRGYCWIFPKGRNRANVGIGIAGYEKKSARYFLDKWISEHPERFKDASVIEENTGGIPVGGFLKDMVSDRLLLIGDAARQVNPIHGGGMYEGMVAAAIAAPVIKSAFESNDFSKEFLKEYERIWWEKRGNRLQNVLKLRQAVETLDDGAFNYLAENLTGDDLMAFSRGERLLKLGRLLTKVLGIKGAAKLLIGSKL